MPLDLKIRFLFFFLVSFVFINGNIIDVIVHPNNTSDEWFIKYIDGEPCDEIMLNLTFPGFDEIFDFGEFFLVKVKRPLSLMMDFANDNSSTDPIRDVIDFIEQGGTTFKSQAIQPGDAVWGLDRIDQNSGLDGRYSYTTEGLDIPIFIFDTGIALNHIEFGGRASFGFDTFNEGETGDCNGHGTHVAGIAGGTNVGVAKLAELISIRVLNCDGSGSVSNIISGLQYVYLNFIPPFVISMSLGGPESPILDSVVNALTRQNSVAIVVAAGNEDSDACDQSPSGSTAITVGSSTINDEKSSFSNFGPCLDLFAPGSGVVSADADDEEGYSCLSGTSMSAPHVSGVAALILGENPTLSFVDIKQEIISNAVSGTLSNIGTGSPNFLLQTPFPDTAALDGSPERTPQGECQFGGQDVDSASSIHSSLTNFMTQYFYL